MTHLLLGGHEFWLPGAPMTPRGPVHPVPENRRRSAGARTTTAS